MANGTNAHQNVAAVKSTVDSLEISPSHHSASSPIAHGGTKAVGHGVSAKTGTMAHKGKNKTRGMPRGSTTHIGKKSHSFQKSLGR